MAGTALQLDLHALREEVGFFTGKGRSWDDIAEDERLSIDAIIGAGLRMFYGAHPWSFLNLSASLAIESGTSEYDLPDDFGFLQGDVTFTDGTRTWSAKQTAQSRIDLAVPKNGIPKLYAVYPKAMDDDTAGQSWGISVWPAPDRELTMNYRYSVQPRTITVNAPYPYGGMYHSETIKEACLMKAEAETDDQPGVHAQLYQAALLRSIEYDKSLSSPDSIGYNGDGRFIPREKRDVKLYLNGEEVPVSPEESSSIYWEE